MVMFVDDLYTENESGIANLFRRSLNSLFVDLAAERT